LGHVARRHVAVYLLFGRDVLGDDRNLIDRELGAVKLMHRPLCLVHRFVDAHHALLAHGNASEGESESRRKQSLGSAQLWEVDLLVLTWTMDDADVHRRS